MYIVFYFNNIRGVYLADKGIVMWGNDTVHLDECAYLLVCAIIDATPLNWLDNIVNMA